MPALEVAGRITKIKFNVISWQQAWETLDPDSKARNKQTKNPKQPMKPSEQQTIVKLSLEVQGSTEPD